MWSTEHSVETSASPEAVWRLWSDIPRWPEWNADLSQAELEGEFSEGSTIRMTSNDGEAVELRIAEALEPERFVDEAELGGITVRTTHKVEPAGPKRLRIVYRMEITGPDADTVGAEVGPRISGDFPEVLAALASRAEGLA
jgi:Polyketide cyclase / dehydrase and lipid transport.